MLGVYCVIHQLALARKVILNSFGGFYSSIVRLGHLFETSTFRSQFRRALMAVLLDLYQYVPVSEKPAQWRDWQKRRNEICSIVSDTSGRFNKKRIQLFRELATFDNGNPEGERVVHWCTGDCCGGHGSQTHDEMSKRAFFEISKYYAILFSFGFPVPLAYRWVHAHREGCGLHQILQRTLAYLSDDKTVNDNDPYFTQLEEWLSQSGLPQSGEKEPGQDPEGWESVAIFMAFASGEMGANLLSSYTELLNKFPSLNAPDVSFEYFNICIGSMAECWRRLVLPTLFFPWKIFRLLSLDTDRWPEEISKYKDTKKACPHCVDYEFSTMILDFLDGGHGSDEDVSSFEFESNAAESSAAQQLCRNARSTIAKQRLLTTYSRFKEAPEWAEVDSGLASAEGVLTPGCLIQLQGAGLFDKYFFLALAMKKPILHVLLQGAASGPNEVRILDSLSGQPALVTSHQMFQQVVSLHSLTGQSRPTIPFVVHTYSVRGLQKLDSVRMESTTDGLEFLSVRSKAKKSTTVCLPFGIHESPRKRKGRAKAKSSHPQGKASKVSSKDPGSSGRDGGKPVVSDTLPAPSTKPPATFCNSELGLVQVSTQIAARLARCRHCSQSIQRGEVRFGYSFHRQKFHSYLHAACTAQHLKLQGASVEQAIGFLHKTKGEDHPPQVLEAISSVEAALRC
ncbi:unnamed protein product [Durusdinium trenchii]|uniref:Uncharacterized protein n=1 Tax=Durusdinium trenchii TaxID=1381693 RepID=A0ABP0IUI3_9DINO